MNAPDDPCWQGIPLRRHIQPFAGRALRLVESQEQIATLRLVDTLAEQAVLESLIEASKPPVRTAHPKLHYLLSTPFRYPPLKHGSRFGTRRERSLFYGSRRLLTVLAEGAYYRLLFYSGMATPPPRALRSRHTVFSVRYRTDHGLKLHEAPFDDHRAVLTDPASYRETQELGTCMRDAGVVGFEFVSARDRHGGLNVGLFQPQALAARNPGEYQDWLCETDRHGVRFLNPRTQRMHQFPIDRFLVDGTLPNPGAGP